MYLYFSLSGWLGGVRYLLNTSLCAGPPTHTQTNTRVLLQMSQTQNSRTVKLNNNNNNADNEATILYSGHTIDGGFFYPRPTIAPPFEGLDGGKPFACVYVHTRRIGWPGAVCGTNAMKWLQKAGGAHDWRSKARGIRRLWRAGQREWRGKCAAKLPSFCAAESCARRKHVPTVYVFFHFRVLSTIYAYYVYVQTE